MIPRFTFDVTGPDDGGRIRSALEAAGETIASHLAPGPILLVSVAIAPLAGPEIGWGSSGEALERPDGLYDPLAVWKLRTGDDPNGAAPDLFVNIDPVKAAGVDLVQLATHELLHGLGFDGWGPGVVTQTALDGLTVAGRFIGAAVEAVNGGPVPMAGPHYALPGLMNPYLDPAHPQTLGVLDLAFLADVGVPTRERFGTVGNDTLAADGGGQAVFAGYGADTVAGHQGADTLDGGPGDDALRGGKGNDLLQGSEGADWLSGDLGDDTLDGGPGNDVFVFRAGDGNDRIDHFETRDRIELPGPYSVTIDPTALTTTLAFAGGSVVLSETNTFDQAWVIA